MSKNIHQVYLANPITSNASTDLMYFGQSPYGVNDDAAMTYANFSAQFGNTTGTANQVLVNGTSGSPVSGNVTLTTPQDIATTSNVQFNSVIAGSLKYATTQIEYATGSVPLINFNTDGSSTHYLNITQNSTLIGTNIEAKESGGGASTLILTSNDSAVLVYGGPNATPGEAITFVTNTDHFTTFNFPTSTFTSQTVTFQDATGTVAFLSDITANGTVNHGTANQIGYYATTGNTISGLTGANSSMLVTDATGVPVMTPSMTNGQIIVGSTGSTPAPATLTAGTGISIANGAGSITISNTTSGMTWTTVSGTSQAAAVNNGYVANNAGAVTVTLPAIAAVGDMVAVEGLGAGGWVLAANIGQTIKVGSGSTSSAGSLNSAVASDNVYVTCIVANTTWRVRTTNSSGLIIS